MQKLNMAAQAFLGLIFFVFGLNGFLNFLPPPELTGDAATFFGGMLSASYFVPFLKTVEMIAGLLLLIRKFPALALLLLAPIVVQIFLFHAFLAPEGIAVAVVVLVLEAYLGFVVYKDRFTAVLAP